MKKYVLKILIVNFILLQISCKTKNKNDINLEKTQNNPEYYLGYKYPIPYEILINDIVVDKNLEGGKNGAENLNQYILKNGEQKVEIKVLHPFIEKGGLLSSQDLSILKAKVYLIEGEEEDMTLIKELNFKEIEKKVPLINQEWSFKATLPFQLIGWGKSKDLKSFEEDELKELVVKKFTVLRELLNTGKTRDFMGELEFRNNEFFIANFFTNSEKNDYLINLEETFKEHKDKMLPLEDFKLRILGNGRAVTLERINKHTGQGVLVAEDKSKNILYLNYIILHIPLGKEELEILRINPLITSLDEK
ncbi:hypothetical protein [Aquimarina aquimarini]|uniref:hypothetical protein n=1 Tax=Aquimarina aquimarini TaxID=1191734 RepID=UPI000D55CA4F|nr:hypothetical protein [Aquimarina aquimarini]